MDEDAGRDSLLLSAWEVYFSVTGELLFDEGMNFVVDGDDGV